MALNGNETLQVLGQDANGIPAATTETTTTGAIAALASSTGIGEATNTAITTVGNGTLTAAAFIGGLITRSGPVAAFSDATATAAQIIAAIGSAFVGQSWYVKIKNTTPFAETLTAGTGVTLPASIIIPANSVGEYLVTLTSLVAVTLVHVDTVPLTSETLEIVTALSTVGAGTITAAGIAGGVTNRTGSVAAFNDTTDTAANIILAQPNTHIGASWEYTYVNNTVATATILGGTGVTPSGITVIPANGWVRYLVTYTAAATITMASIANGSFSADATDPTKQIIFKTSGATTATATTLVAAQTAARVLTLPDATDTLAGIGATQTLTNKTLTAPVINNPVSTGPAPIAVGASISVSAAHAGATYLLNTAGGSVATLPAATGTGNKYRFFVSTSTTSAAHKILAASGSDFFSGNITGQNATAVKQFTGLVSNSYCSLQMPNAGTQPSGGIQGDWFEFEDEAANLWAVKGMFSAGTTPTTPFNTATS